MVRAARIGEHGAFLWIASTALVLRCIAAFLQSGLTYDGTYYLRQASRLLRFDYDASSFPPGYPAVVALFSLLVRDLERAGQLVSLLGGTAVVILTYQLARARLRAGYALALGLALAVHPHFVRYSVLVLSDSLYMACVLLAILRYEARHDAQAGMLLGFAFLARPEAVLITVVLAALRARTERRVPTALLVPALLPVAGYVVFISRPLGHVALSPKQAFLDLHGDLGARIWITLVRMHAAFPLILLPVAVVQAVRTRSALIAPALYVLALPLFRFNIETRYHLPALPFLAILGLSGAATLGARPRRALLAAAAILLVAGTAPGYVELFHPPDLSPHAKEVGAMLRPFLRFEDRVAARFPFVPYYAGAGFVRAPMTRYHVAMDSLVELHASHILVLENEVMRRLPQFRPLFDEPDFVAAEGRIELVTSVQAFPGSRALLYRLREPALPARSWRTVSSAAAGAAWLGRSLWVSTSDGRLVMLNETAAGGPWTADNKSTRASRVAQLTAAETPGVSPDTTRLVFVTRCPNGMCIGELDLESGSLRLHPETVADQPSCPAYLGNRIVYVRRAQPAQLRALDLRTGQRMRLDLQGSEDWLVEPRSLAVRGNDLAVVYAPLDSLEGPLHVVAAASGSSIGETAPSIELPTRWVARLPLHDDGVCWLGAGDCLLASVDRLRKDARGRVIGRSGNLYLLRGDGRVRQLTYADSNPRRPALRHGEIAFVTGSSDLIVSPIAEAELRIPAVTLFEAASRAPEPAP